MVKCSIQKTQRNKHHRKNWRRNCSTFAFANELAVIFLSRVEINRLVIRKKKRFWYWTEKQNRNRMCPWAQQITEICFTKYEFCFSTSHREMLLCEIESVLFFVCVAFWIVCNSTNRSTTSYLFILAMNKFDLFG